MNIFKYFYANFDDMREDLSLFSLYQPMQNQNSKMQKEGTKNLYQRNEWIEARTKSS